MVDVGTKWTWQINSKLPTLLARHGINDPYAQAAYLWLMVGDSASRIPGLYLGTPTTVARELNWPIRGGARWWASIASLRHAGLIKEMSNVIYMPAAMAVAKWPMGIAAAQVRVWSNDLDAMVGTAAEVSIICAALAGKLKETPAGTGAKQANQAAADISTFTSVEQWDGAREGMQAILQLLQGGKGQQQLIDELRQHADELAYDATLSTDEGGHAAIATARIATESLETAIAIQTKNPYKDYPQVAMMLCAKVATRLGKSIKKVPAIVLLLQALNSVRQL